jgi:hypothetical protein
MKTSKAVDGPHNQSKYLRRIHRESMISGGHIRYEKQDPKQENSPLVRRTGPGYVALKLWLATFAPVGSELRLAARAWRSRKRLSNRRSNRLTA